MENIEATLRSADQAASAPFTQVPRAPLWYPPVMAAYFTTLFGALLLLVDEQLIFGAGLLILAIAAVVLLTLTVRMRWGTWPRLAEAPTEIRWAFGLYVLLAITAFVATVAVWLRFGEIPGLITIFMATLVSVTAYEFGLYPSAAQRVRNRLA